MFFKKNEKCTLEQNRRQEKFNEVQLAKYGMEALAKTIFASYKVILVLPDGADKDAEIEFCEQQKKSLLCAIGNYDVARQEYALLCGKPLDDTPFFSSHEVLRTIFQKTYWQIAKKYVII